MMSSLMVLLDIPELSREYLADGFTIKEQQISSLQIDARTDSRIIVLDINDCCSGETLQSFLENLVASDDEEQRYLPIQVISAPHLQASSTATLWRLVNTIPYANKRLFMVLGSVSASKKRVFLVDFCKECKCVGFGEMRRPVDLISLGFGSLDAYPHLDRDDDEPRDSRDPFYDDDDDDDQDTG